MSSVLPTSVLPVVKWMFYIAGAALALFAFNEFDSSYDNSGGYFILFLAAASFSVGYMAHWLNLAVAYVLTNAIEERQKIVEKTEEQKLKEMGWTDDAIAKFVEGKRALNK